MSKANSVTKVLRVALKRVQTRWGQGAWSNKDQRTGQYLVCLEGAVTGGCAKPQTQPQRDAIRLLNEVLVEQYPELEAKLEARRECNPDASVIPDWNDSVAAQEDVERLVKLALVRAETGWPEADYIDPDEVETLITPES